MFWGKKHRKDASRQAAHDLLTTQRLTKIVASVLAEVVPTEPEVSPRTVAVLSIITSDALCQRLKASCSFELVASIAATGLLAKTMRGHHSDPEKLGEAIAREMDRAGEVFNAISCTTAGLVVVQSMANQMTALCVGRMQIDAGERESYDQKRLENARQSLPAIAVLVAKHG